MRGGRKGVAEGTVGYDHRDVMDLYHEFEKVVETLDAHHVPYALCGGLAMAVHGYPRATVDIDLLLKEKSVEAVKAALLPLGFEEIAYPMQLGETFIRRLTKLEKGGPDYLVIDLLLTQGAASAFAWKTRVRRAWKEGRIPVVSKQGLIALKRLRSSKQDLADIAVLEGKP